MNTCQTPTAPLRPHDDDHDKGFTLIEILIAIVLVGILSAVAVVGISNLVSKGSTSACQASADSAKAASAVYFASNTRYPVTFGEMTTAGTDGAPLSLPSGVNVNTAAAAAIVGPPATPAAAIGQRATGSGWIMTMTPGVGGAAPTFVCT